MKQFVITFKNQPAQTINVWDHEKPEVWLQDLEEYFRIAGYVFAKADIVSVSESEFGRKPQRHG